MNLIGKYVETIDGHKGQVIKHFKPTGRDMTVHIKQVDGRERINIMEDEIKVGEYVRTKLGDIKQITEGFEFVIERLNKSDNYITKHNANIIDLIEVRRLCKRKNCNRN